MQLNINSELQCGKYRILRVLGQGGFGITYLAEHTMLNKLVAIKEFFPKEYCNRDATSSHVTIGTQSSENLVAQLKNKFIKEARNISRLHHPNIIIIHDIFQENDTAYYVMEYVDGASLSEIVNMQGAMSEPEAIGYVRKIAEAVSYMHSLSMNHLDLKPANIMIRQMDREPILIDFGLSKQYDASGGQTSTTPVGISHGFAPIEQYRPGGVAMFTPQTDIYALGATLYNLLSGTLPPHYSDILEDGLPKFPTTVSERVTNAVVHAMEIKKNRRPNSITEFLSELGDSTLKDSSTPLFASNGIPHDDKTIPKLKMQAAPGVKSIDDTMMIGEGATKNNTGRNNETITIDDIEFVDLGLSVRWANRNIGAKDYKDPGIFFSKRMDGNLNDFYQWNMQGGVVPSVDNFRELLTQCSWYWACSDEGMGYTVVGPNGNSISLCVTGEGNTYHESGIVTFGLLWTNEALLNDWRTESLLLYFNSSNRLLNHYYITSKMCPIRLVLK